MGVLRRYPRRSRGRNACAGRDVNDMKPVHKEQLMTSMTVHLQQREEVADRTIAFHFSKPAGFSYTPGQAIDLILPSAVAGAESMRHAFSIVSAPHESDLVVTTRMRDSAFKHALARLPVGG